MARISPLLERHLAAGASLVPWGEGEGAARVVESFGEIELEYAAIRKFVGVLDLPHRGAIIVGGSERVEFLNRMVTHDVRTVPAGQTRRAFLTNRKGRIDADLRIAVLGDRIAIDLDATVAPAVAEGLRAYLFAEDVTVTDATETTHRIALHGPAAARLVGAVAPAHAEAVGGLRAGEVVEIAIGGHAVVVERFDSTGDPGYELLMPVEGAADVHAALLGAGLPPPRESAESAHAAVAHPFRLRRIGWHAWNIARIEAGTPVFLIDFGPDSLPAETGVLHDRVSFTKGCYPGQEVVARMHHLGHPRQVLAAIRVAAPDGNPHWQPVTGAAVVPADATEETPAVGAVTSSTRAPMLSDALICFAQVKWDHASPGKRVGVRTALGVAPGEVQESLHFWKRAAPAGA